MENEDRMTEIRNENIKLGLAKLLLLTCTEDREARQRRVLLGWRMLVGFGSKMIC